MNKIMNNKGFVLVETLVVSVFVVTVFTFLYINVIPLVGSYEEEENYDSIDTKYIGNLLKNEITYGFSEENKLAIEDSIKVALSDNKVSYFNLSKCDGKITIDTLDGEKEVSIYGGNYDETYIKCNELRTIANIKEVYLTKYNIKELKEKVKEENKKNKHLLNSQMDAYISFLPTYETIPSDAQYRIILSIGDIYDNDKLYFGTIDLDI